LIGVFLSVRNFAVASKVSLFPRVSVKPAVMELFHGPFTAATTAGSVFFAGASTFGATLVMVTTLVTNTYCVTTLVIVTTLFCADAFNKNAVIIPATHKDTFFNFIN